MCQVAGRQGSSGECLRCPASGPYQQPLDKAPKRHRNRADHAREQLVAVGKEPILLLPERVHALQLLELQSEIQLLLPEPIRSVLQLDA